MELTERQKELLERAKARAAGQPVGGFKSGGLAARRGDNPMQVQTAPLGGGMTARQRELLQLGATRAGVSAGGEDDDGFSLGSYLSGLGKNVIGNTVRGVAVTADATNDFLTAQPAREFVGGLLGVDNSATRPQNLFTRLADDFVADPLAESAEQDFKNMGAEAFNEFQRSGIEGSITDPLNLRLREGTTARGLALKAGEAISTLVPILLARNPAQAAALGFFQGAGGAVEETERGIQDAAKDVDKNGVSRLARESARYNQLIDAGETHESAVEVLTAEAQRASGVTAGLIAGGGGVLTQRIVDPATRLFAGLGTAGNIAARGALGAVEEGAQEVAEGVGSRFAAQSVTGLETDLLAGTGEEFVLGSVAGGVVGGASGLRRPQKGSGTDFDAQLAAEQAEEDAILAQEAQAREAAVVSEQQELRDRFAPTFVPPKEFEKQRAKRREADVLDPNTELGREFQAWRREQGVYHPDEYPKAAKEFLKAATPENDADIARQEYLDALDAHAEQMLRVDEALTLTPSMRTKRGAAQSATEEPAKPEKPANKKPTKKEQARIDAEERLGPNWEVENPDLSSMVEDGKSIYAKKRGKQPKFWQRLDEIEAELNSQAQEQAQEQDTSTPQERADGARGGWVIREKNTGEVVMETRDRAKVEALNTERYEAVPVRQHLADLNRDTPAARAAGQPVTSAEQDTSTPQAPTEQQVSNTAPTEQQTPTELPDVTPVNTPSDVQANAPAKQADPAARRQEVIARANQDLGPDWMAQNEDLVEQLGRGEFDAVEQAVAKRALEQEPKAETETQGASQPVTSAEQDTSTPQAAEPTQTPTATQSTDLAKAFELGAVDNAELSGNERKVWEVLRNAFANNEQDTVIQPGGQWNATRIAELAGLNSRQAAQTALTRLKPKIAKASGLKESQIKARLRETAEDRRTVEEAPDINAPREVFDTADLGEGGGAGTLESANQGARRGVSKEDAEYMEQRSQEPDLYKSKRQELADRARRAATRNAVQRSGRKALALWKSLSVESGANVDVQSLTKADLTDWVNAVDEFESGASTEAQLVADHRAIEQNYDATGGVTQESIDAEDTAANEGREAESPAGTQEEDTGAPPSEGSRDQTDAGRGEDTGQRRAAETDTGVVGEQKARPKVETRKRKKTIRPEVETRKQEKAARSDQEAFDQAAKGKKPRLSVAEVEAEVDGVTARKIRHAVKWLLGESDNARVIVVRSPEDLIGLVLARQIPLSGAQLGHVLNAENPYGFVQPDSNGVAYAYFFSDNLSPGRERGAVMHEIGGHIGLDSLDQDVRDAAYDQILDWAERDDNSPEANLAKRAVERVRNAEKRGGLQADDALELADLTQSETLAYFIEEAILAGYNPTVESGGKLQSFLHKLWKAYKAALAKFTGNKDQPLYIEDFLDLARGAAKLDFINGAIRDGIGARFSISPEQGAASQRQWAERTFGGETATQFIDTAKAVWKGGTNSIKPMSRFIRDVADGMPSAQRWWDALLASKQTKREWAGGVEEIANRARQLAPERKARLYKFIGDSTFYQQWGYDPKIEGKEVTVNPIMARRFAKLTSEERQIARDVFQHGEDVRNEMNEIAKELGIDKLFTVHSKLRGPYAPLKRFGGNVVALRSRELLDAEAALRKVNNKINRDRVEKLKSNPDHYVVQFFDTMGAAKKFANAQRGKYAEAVASQREPDTGNNIDTSSKAYQRILAALNAGDGARIPKESKAAVEAMIKDLYFQSLEETSARLSGARRLNRAGYDPDMMRSFVSHGRAQAQLIAQMKHGGEINAALVAARDEVRAAPASERERLQNTFNVIAEKNADLLKPRNGLLDKIQDHVLAFNTAYMLTSSLGYHITNKLQPIYSVAKIGADFGAYNEAWRYLFSGEKIARQVVDTSFMKQIGTVVTSGFVDLNNKLEIKVENAPAKYQPLLRELQLRDLLDVGIEEDLNLDNRFDFGFSTLNKVNNWYQNTSHRLYQTARFVEAHNRIASAISAYEVAQRRPNALRRMDMTAKDYAIGLVQDTHGDFSAEETPLLLSKLPRWSIQFRKYQVLMLWLHADPIKRSFSRSTPRHERVAAIRTMAYLFGTTGFMSGAVGLPAASLGLMLFQMAFGDEDDPEPKDLERMIREHFSEDPQMATLISRGVPAFFGLDMSAKMSLNDLFQPWDTRFVQPEATYKGAATFLGQLTFGPTAGVAGNFFTAAGYFQEGDVYRGVERSVPKGVRSIMESLRYAQEGYRTPNNVMLADPREFDLFDLMSNAMGLPSAKINTLKWKRGQQWELERWFRTENARLRERYVEAFQDKDRAAQKKLLAEYRDLQKAKRRVRPFFNNAPGVLHPQPTSNLTGAVRDFRRRQQEARRKIGKFGSP